MDDRRDSPSIDDLALEYLRAAESGQQPDTVALAARLPDDAARAEFQALIETAELVRSALPAPFRPRMLIGGRYRLCEELGSGGFGRVFRAHDEHIGRDVALKLFHGLIDAEQLESTLRRERESLARIQHDGVVRLLDHGRHEETHFLAMDFVPGRPLDTVLAELAAAGDPPPVDAVMAACGPVSPGGTSLVDDDWYRTAARVAAAIAAALAAAHAEGIVHRDLKPGNVLLRPGGWPVLLDFGLAGLAGLATGDLTGRLFGTLAYVAPEQLQAMRTGKAAAIDVYQCGLILYELLAFRRAFCGEERGSLLDAVRHGRFMPPRQIRRSVPRELEDICLRALESAPARRYPSAAALRRELERWLDGDLPDAARLGNFGRVGRRARRLVVRHRWIALSAVFATVGAAAALWLGDRGPAVIAIRNPDGSYAVTMARAGRVLAVLRSITAEGRVAGIDPLPLVAGSVRPELLVALPAGTTMLRVLEQEAHAPLPEAVRTEVHFVAIDEQQLEVAQLIVRHVADEAGRQLQAVPSERVHAIHDAALSAARGGAVPVALDRDWLLR